MLFANRRGAPAVKRAGCTFCGSKAHDEAHCAADPIENLDDADARLEEQLAADLEAALEAHLESDLAAQFEAQLESWIATANDGSSPKRRKRKDTLPSVKVTTALAECIDAAECVLADDPDVYIRDYGLVHVTRVTHLEAQASPDVRIKEADGSTSLFKSLVAGTPRIHQMAPATLRERLTRVAIFEKWSKTQDDWAPCLPSDPIVQGLHARKQWPHLRSIVGIAEAPFMRADGSVCQEPGYDVATGYEYIPPQWCRFEKVPQAPSREDAHDALMKVQREIYGDFQFNPDHASVPIAAILTILARPAIIGSTPIFVFDGNVPGVGKTLVTDTIAVTVSGRPMPRMNYPASEEEQEKVLGGYAMQGATFFSLDDITPGVPFGGAPLNRVATSGASVQLRILGKSHVPTVLWVAVICATGNNIELKGDMPPRVLVARQESTLEDPRTRTGFRHDNLPAWIRHNRPWIVPALLTVLRAYVAAGRPDVKTKRWGSFEAWSSLIPPAIVWAGGADPMNARIREIAAISDEHRQMAAILEMWPRLIECIYTAEKKRWDAGKKDQPKPTLRWGLSASEAIHSLYDGDASDKSSFDPLRDAVEALCCPRRASGEVRPTAVALGHKLRGFKKRTVGGKRFTSVTNTHTKVDTWAVEDATGNDDGKSNVVELKKN